MVVCACSENGIAGGDSARAVSVAEWAEDEVRAGDKDRGALAKARLRSQAGYTMEQDSHGNVARCVRLQLLAFVCIAHRII